MPTTTVADATVHHLVDGAGPGLVLVDGTGGAAEKVLGLAAPLADAWPPPGIGRQIDAGLHADVTKLLPAITAPTLVIGFADDAMIPIDGSHRLHDGIAGSRPVALVREFLDRGRDS